MRSRDQMGIGSLWGKRSTEGSGAIAMAAMLAALTAAFGASPARAEHTRVTNPNAVSLEVFGRGLLYSISFDRVMSDDLVAGVGFGRAPLDEMNGEDANASTSLVPVYMNYYFMREANAAFVTAGATLVVNNDDAKNRKATYSGVEFGSSMPLLPNFGAGFESRSDAGFLFRVAAYGVIGKNIAPWFGFTLGYSF